MTLRKALQMEFFPESRDLGLLLLRLVAISIFLKHGVEKLLHYGTIRDWLARSHHYVSLVGLGPSMFYATLCDGVLSVLIVFGVATRWCALLTIANLLGAWWAIGFPYFTRPAGTDGELILAYIACMTLLLLLGPGRLSVDALFARSRTPRFG